MNEQSVTSGTDGNKTIPPTKEEKALSEKAAETLAGDNTFMAALLKILISPLTLILGGAVVLYWMSASKTEKEAHAKLKREHEDLQEQYGELKKKYKKLKALAEPEKQAELPGLSDPQKMIAMPTAKKTYRTAYLD
jgi:uncharacterized protein YlxW (UPF0749 family)